MPMLDLSLFQVLPLGSTCKGAQTIDQDHVPILIYTSLSTMLADVAFAGLKKTCVILSGACLRKCYMDVFASATCLHVVLPSFSSHVSESRINEESSLKEPQQEMNRKEYTLRGVEMTTGIGRRT